MTGPTDASALTPTVLREYDEQAPTDTETATFGLGCFWGPDATFGAVDGVVRTRVGYAGGTKPDPSYETLGDHTEVVQVDYDPRSVSFADLLGEAFEAYSPRRQAAKRQYQSIIFTATDDQRAQLVSFLDANGDDPEEIETRIESLSGFHLAESYHQKFNLRGQRWVTESFENVGYDDSDLRESPAAAKLNAHLAGRDVSVPFLREREA